MFLGTFEHSIDEKSRFTIPAKFREDLSDGLVITAGVDPCLLLYPKKEWSALAAKVSALPLTSAEGREFGRQLFASAADDVPDKQGRVTVPNFLLKYAGIDKSATIVGQNTYCEIWDTEAWKERRDRMHRDPEGRAAMFASLGI